jgi:hypothetical protein
MLNDLTNDQISQLCDIEEHDRRSKKSRFGAAYLRRLRGTGRKPF